MLDSQAEDRNLMTPTKPVEPPPPTGFQVKRGLTAGRHPLLVVFPGLNRLPPFRKYPLSPRARRTLATTTEVEIAPRKGEWMYVAPHVKPVNADPRWRPVVTDGNCVVVSREHLRKSPALVLYLDIIHELLHVVQRNLGRELWDETYSYVNRPTELEAYQLAVDEARRLDIPDAFLREYLKVQWTSPSEHRQLLKNLGVPTAARRRA
ncbi:MAG: hypothetical protein L3K10_04680 [Thermoplasmata archaeon]|nr:hypothetical protein [Thermoplasmata archaeon]